MIFLLSLKILYGLPKIDEFTIISSTTFRDYFHLIRSIRPN